MEGLVDSIEHVVNVRLQDTSLVVVYGRDVALYNIGIGSAELSNAVRS